jgi:3-hydroxyisobutyrate dehydrogenase-like beta-hydroxyacid dehydrogenase
METIGFIGVGKIGLPICEHLIKAGHRVLGYRRSSLANFEKIGGIPAQSPAEIAERADLIFACLSSDEALEEVVNGPHGLIHAVRPGQIVVEFGSHPVPVKQRYVAILASKGVPFLDGEVGGTPGMVVAKKAAIYVAGDEKAAKSLDTVVARFAEVYLYLGAFGAATTVKLLNNTLVALHITGTAQVMAIGLKAGCDPALMIKAIVSGSGASTQFGIRAPWMAERRFMPQQGSAPGLFHYLDGAKELAESVGAGTQLLDCLIEIFKVAVPRIGERDIAAILEHFDSRPEQANPH